MPTEAPILPGATLGLLGGGQLGRYFTISARTQGYKVMVLDPDPASPAGALADTHLVAAYDDADALDTLAHCAAVTTEFENVPAATLEWLAARTRIAPPAQAVAIAQDRAAEKTWLAAHGFATAPFAVIETAAQMPGALARIGTPAILKSARLGYDGKGQARIDHPDAAAGALAHVGLPAVLEARLPLDTELSVIVARNAAGRAATYPVVENIHRRGILHLSLVPARVPVPLAEAARTQALAIAEALDYSGVLAVEFFVSAGQIRVNELAPRPHNSGHFSLDACAFSQFDQQVRTLCGLAPADTRLDRAAAMLNLLGDSWRHGHPDWTPVLDRPNARLHLYGKAEARPGRKMGHLTVLADTVEAALADLAPLADALA